MWCFDGKNLYQGEPEEFGFHAVEGEDEELLDDFDDDDVDEEDSEIEDIDESEIGSGIGVQFWDEEEVIDQISELVCRDIAVRYIGDEPVLTIDDVPLAFYPSDYVVINEDGDIVRVKEEDVILTEEF